jgi:methionine synthase I (cobalamin-dependent)/5,10-methylenetetrahydrofolate reductase
MTRNTRFLDRIARAPLVFDGAMGTMIYQRGVFINACYDELCLTRPELILDIHQEYVEAGADVIESNTFGANRLKLAPFGLADKVEAINRRGVELARQAAGDDVLVAASVGPCLDADKPFEPDRADELARVFAEQLAVIADAGADLVLLETFDKIPELQIAAAQAAGAGLAVLASFAVREEHGKMMGFEPEAFAAQQLQDDDNVHAVGMNCGTGPAGYVEQLARVLAATTKPVIAMPNAGGPRELGGRMLYLNSPEYYTEYAKRYVEMGARGVGGCCGTTPQHIRMAARAIKGLSGVKEHVAVATRAADDSKAAALAAKAVATSDKGPFAARLCAGEKVTSVEILPPRTGAGLEAFLERCRQCGAAGVDAINIPDGPRATARISVLASALAVLQQTDIEPIPHYCCRDRNLIGMQSDILGAAALGLSNWLFITGDPPKLGDYPDATGVFDVDAIGLTQLVRGLNHGYDAAGLPVDPPTGVLIGVGANPVAVEPQRERDRFRAKIDAGAEYAITQPVFDPDALLRFCDEADTHNRTIPIVAGLYPLISLRNAEFMNEHVPGVVVPGKVLDRMSRCKTKEDGIAAGIEIAREMRLALADRVAGFQVSAPLGRIEVALDVLAD